MARNIEIKCINKGDRTDPHERISHIGGINGDGTRWRLSLVNAISGIEAGKWNFWVVTGGKPVQVMIAIYNGHKYLKTVADGIEPNNLLALPECP